MKAVWQASVLLAVLLACFGCLGHQTPTVSASETPAAEESLLQDAKGLVDAGRFDEAIQKLTKLTQERPEAKGVERNLWQQAGDHHGTDNLWIGNCNQPAIDFSRAYKAQERKCDRHNAEEHFGAHRLLISPPLGGLVLRWNQAQ